MVCFLTGARTRASIAVSLFDHSNPYKRTQAQLSAGSTPAAYSPSSSSSLLGPLNLHMYLDQALLPGVLAPRRPFDIGTCIEEDELEHETSSQPSLSTYEPAALRCTGMCGFVLYALLCAVWSDQAPWGHGSPCLIPRLAQGGPCPSMPALSWWSWGVCLDAGVSEVPTDLQQSLWQAGCRVLRLLWSWRPVLVSLPLWYEAHCPSLSPAWSSDWLASPV